MRHASRLLVPGLPGLLLGAGIAFAQAPEADIAAAPTVPGAADTECADLCARSYQELLDGPTKDQLKVCEATQTCLVRLKNDPRYGFTAHVPIARDLLERLLDPFATLDPSYDG